VTVITIERISMAVSAKNNSGQLLFKGSFDNTGNTKAAVDKDAIQVAAANAVSYNCHRSHQGPNVAN
jgi:hypothetical protein